MVRFYGLPEPFKMPVWWLNVLHKCIAPLRAEEELARGVLVTMQTDQKGYKKSFADLKRMATPYQEPEIVMIDPKDEKWFKDNGIPYKVKD